VLFLFEVFRKRFVFVAGENLPNCRKEDCVLALPLCERDRARAIQEEVARGEQQAGARKSIIYNLDRTAHEGRRGYPGSDANADNSQRSELLRSRLWVLPLAGVAPNRFISAAQSSGEWRSLNCFRGAVTDFNGDGKPDIAFNIQTPLPQRGVLALAETFI
jgi:hypothetical protein